MEMARQGYFIRGAISVGDLYMDNEIIFGPGLLDAYENERSQAVYPRVILSTSAVQPYLMEPWRWIDRWVPDVMIDFDRRIFVDYLEANVMIAFPDEGPFTDVLDEHKAAIQAKLTEFAAVPRIREKYEWLAGYHNSFCRRYPSEFNEQNEISNASLPPPEPWRPEGLREE
jgi:hypothetical protein